MPQSICVMNMTTDTGGGILTQPQTSVMNMTLHSTTAADEALKGVGKRWSEALG
jgi:hypothetical protein